MARGNIQLPTKYFFNLSYPGDGITTSPQVSTSSLYYTTADCSGTAYSNATYSVVAGSIFLGYTGVNATSLFYVPRSAVSTQIQPISSRAAASSILSATISFNGLAASGNYMLSFNGMSTAAINWNDNAAQIQAKISAGLPAIVDTNVTVNAYGLTIYYQTPAQTSGSSFSVTNNTLLTNAPASIVATVSAAPVAAGACAPTIIFQNLNTLLTPVTSNDPSVTGLSVSTFAQPITID